jgi:tetratricopeptide (TPR) repeat protein
MRASEREPGHDAPVQAAPAGVRSAGPHGVLALQRQAGNRATAALVLARREAEPKALREGAKGAEVILLQVHLNQLDEVDVALEADGRFGPITAKALRQFKAAHGLDAKAEADAATLAAIGLALAEPQEPEKIAAKLFALGAAAYSRGDFAAAYDFFTRTSTLADRPGVLFSRAQALRRLGGRRAEAIALYEAYLATDAPGRAKDAESALADLRTPERTGDADKDADTARKIFAHGAKLYEQGDFAHAYDEFTRAGEVVDRPGIVFSRAQALRRLGAHGAEAVALYEEYLASTDPGRRKDAEDAIAEIQGPAATGDEAADTKAAKASFEGGAAAYAAGHFGRAGDAFHISGRLAPGRAGIIFSEAQALRRLGGHAEEAAGLYDAYVAAGGERAGEAAALAEALRSQGAAP